MSVGMVRSSAMNRLRILIRMNIRWASVQRLGCLGAVAYGKFVGAYCVNKLLTEAKILNKQWEMSKMRRKNS